MDIGKNIAYYRKQRGMTQEELGVQLGVTNQAVSKWESAVSMPDILLLPRIAEVLGITLEDIYGLPHQKVKTVVSADEFPGCAYQKLVEFFFDNTKMRFGRGGSTEAEQLACLRQYLANGERIGCLSNTGGAVVATGDFAFVDCRYKAAGSEESIRESRDSAYVLRYLTDTHLRKVLLYQYKTAIAQSEKNNSEFTFDDVMTNCGLSEEETAAALRLLQDIRLNEVYTDQQTHTRKYVLLYSNAVYALAIYRIAAILSEDAVWAVVRDTSMISDYAF